MADLLDDEELRYSGEINVDSIKSRKIVEQLGYNDMSSLLA